LKSLKLNRYLGSGIFTAFIITVRPSSKRALAFAPKGNQSVIQVKYDGYRSHRGLPNLGMFIDIYLTVAELPTKLIYGIGQSRTYP
jgi:hypothetical protein